MPEHGIWAGSGDLDAGYFNRNSGGDIGHRRRPRLVPGRLGATTAFAGAAGSGSEISDAKTAGCAFFPRGNLSQWREF
jgi:hypothetical protein